MKIVKDESLSVLHQVFGWRGRDRLSLAVMAGFTLCDQPRLVDEADLWDRVATELGPNQVLDLCMPKPKGEVLILGKCFAGKDREIQAATAFFRVGRLEKRVEVFGDRYFKLGLLGSHYIKPQPFSVMDITWKNAFGGPGFGLNPEGKGLLPMHTTEGDRLLPMPNIENPARLMTSPDDRPQPAGLGPMGLNWPGRLKNLGTFDRKWLLERWPGLPDDFDFGYYNLAPADQQVDGCFQGNEFLLIRGMHPAQHEILSRLPNRRCRLFINQAHGGEESFQEMTANLDTVYLIPHLELGLLIWHGTTAVADDEAGDVLHIAAFQENLDEPLQPLEFYHSKLDEPPEEPLEEVVIPEASEQPEAPVDQPEAPDTPDPAEALALIASLEQDIADKEAQFNQRLIEWGVDPQSIEPPPQSDKIIPLPTKDESPEALLAQMEQTAEEHEKKLDDFLKSHGLDPEEPSPEPPLPPPGPEMANVGAFLSHFIKLGVTDPESLDGLRELYDDHQAAVAELVTVHGHVEGIQAPLPDASPDTGEEEKAESLPYTRERVLEDYQSGRDFKGADLSGLDLSECRLPGIDLSGAVLEKADLSGSDLSGAKMDGALLTGSNFTRTQMANASLTETTAAEALFVEADLTGGRLTGSDFSKCDFSQSRLSGADLTNSVISGAQLVEAGCSGLLGSGVDLQASDLTGASFEKADLRSADLSGATLTNTNFKGVQAEELQLYGVKGEKADFRGAQLARSRSGDSAVLAGSCFSGADLTGAAWEETDLTGADFSNARMAKAKINQCLLPDAALSGVFARGTDFSKSDLSRAKMTAIDLLGGSLRKAILAETDLRIANLYGVDFYKAKMARTRVDGANLDRTLLTLGHTQLK